ncbi:MAG: hypothetical protein AAFQ19_06445 [Pseudomonadota bacterium]
MTGNTTFRLGIVGHRWNKLGQTDMPRLTRRLAEAFAQIADGQPGVTLVCGLAEGTDILAAATRAEGWGLEAVLALPPEAWRAHVARQGGVTAAELSRLDAALAVAEIVVVPQADAPNYAGVADHLLQTCDHILAVWDGAPGPSAGTYDVLTRARAAGLPCTVVQITAAAGQA